MITAAVIGVSLLVAMATGLALLFWLDHRSGQAAAARWRAQRHAARHTPLARRRPQDDLSGWWQ